MVSILLDELDTDRFSLSPNSGSAPSLPEFTKNDVVHLLGGRSLHHIREKKTCHQELLPSGDLSEKQLADCCRCSLAPYPTRNLHTKPCSRHINNKRKSNSMLPVASRIYFGERPHPEVQSLLLGHTGRFGRRTRFGYCYHSNVLTALNENSSMISGLCGHLLDVTQ